MTDYPTSSNFIKPLPAYPVKQCFDLNDNLGQVGNDGWIWQSCTELVLESYGDSKDSMFPAYNYTYTGTFQSCKDYFKVAPRPTWIATEFGAHALQIGLQIAVHLSSHIWIELDAAAVAILLTSGHQGSWQIQHPLMRIRALLRLSATIPDTHTFQTDTAPLCLRTLVRMDHLGYPAFRFQPEPEINRVRAFYRQPGLDRLARSPLELARKLLELARLTWSESENCYQVIKRSWQEIEETAAKPGGLEILRNSFRICKNHISAGSLENWLYTAYTYTAMTDYPTSSNFLKPLPAYPVKQMCKAIDNVKTGNTFEKLYRAASVYYNYTGQAKCFDLNDNLGQVGNDGWAWQACTEIVVESNGDSKDSMFPAYNYNYTAIFQSCKDYFKAAPRPTWIATEFGAHNICRVLKRSGSNIIFFNGLRDPWSPGGVLKNISESIVAIVAKEGAHHVDLRFSTSEDPKWLQDVRKEEVHIISKWLTQYHHDLIDSQCS
ncbi:serine carboxypeptidase S28 family protein [Striga asiatica]|uniref:Serine carboxypeptidase S28 family protein n=1 Tax=Striga asiatica TaxID=4170 RepID=A0A5A7R5K6_STRAF|nr:serine carboxypeptidase S28 family protein [Striga asiatica]